MKSRALPIRERDVCPGFRLHDCFNQRNLLHHDRRVFIEKNICISINIAFALFFQGSRAVFLVCRHRFASESSAKSSNIRELGFIIRDIIKRSQLVNFDVLMSGKKKVSKKNKSIISNLSVKLFRHQTQ